MTEQELLIWEFFNIGRLIAATGGIVSIISIWLALRVANLTRENPESDLFTKILSSAFGLLIVAGTWQAWTINAANWVNTAYFLQDMGVDAAANPEFVRGFIDYVGSTGELSPPTTPSTLGIMFLIVVSIMILGLIWSPKK